MIAWDTVLCAAAALCTSGRGSLLMLITLSLTQLFTGVVSALWKWWELSHTRHATVLTAVAFGCALWRCFTAIGVQNAADLGSPLPLAFLFVLCGAVADVPLSASRFLKGVLVVLLVGCLREALATASLFHIPLGYTGFGEVFGRHTDGTLGIGGLLVAAAIVWLWGMSNPIRVLPPTSARTALLVGLFTASARCILSLFPSLSLPWRFWSVLTVGLWLYHSVPFPCGMTLITAVAVCIPSELTLVTAIGVGCLALVLSAALPAVVNRLARASLPRGFAGPSLYITLAAVTSAVWGAL